MGKILQRQLIKAKNRVRIYMRVAATSLGLTYDPCILRVITDYVLNDLPPGAIARMSDGRANKRDLETVATIAAPYLRAGNRA